MIDNATVSVWVSSDHASNNGVLRKWRNWNIIGKSQ